MYTIPNHEATGDPGHRPISPQAKKNRPVVLGPSDRSSVITPEGENCVQVQLTAFTHNECVYMQSKNTDASVTVLAHLVP